PSVRVLPSPPLLRFLVRLVLVAPRAVLLPFRPLRVLAPVLGGEVVPAFAHGAFHDDVFPRHRSALLQDLGDHAGAHRAPAFPDREPQLLLHRNRRDQLDRHLRVVPRHHHLHPRRELHRPRHIRRPQIKLRPIPLEKGRVPAPLILRQHVHFTLKLRVRRDALRLRQDHPPLHLVHLDAPQQQPDVVPRLPHIQQLPEHLHPRHHHLPVRPKPHHLHLLLHLHLPPLDPPLRHCAPAGGRKHAHHPHPTASGTSPPPSPPPSCPSQTPPSPLPPAPSPSPGRSGPWRRCRGR